MSLEIIIRDAELSDLDAIVALDEQGQENKRAYWLGIMDHYVKSGRADRLFLVAEKDRTQVGYIVGEVRAWEFGSPPCGWVFALAVSQGVREMGVAHRMFNEICNRMKQTGVTTVRTMINIDDKVTLSFFRSVGMCTGRYIELEKHLEE